MEKGAIIKHEINKAPRTGDWRHMKPVVDTKKCTGCLTCVPYCPDASIELKKYRGYSRNKAGIDYAFCKGCGVCAQICPLQAIIMKKE